MSRGWLRARNVRRDYSRKSFSNPLFAPSRHGTEGRRRWRGRMIALAGFLAAVGWTWFVAFSSVFKVTEIRIKGNDRLQAWEIEDAVKEALAERRWLIFPQNSLIVASEEKIADFLNQRFVLQSLSLTKRPPHALEIELKESVSAVLMQFPDGGQALLDLDGAVTKVYKPEEALETALKQGPTLEEKQGRSRPLYPLLFDDKAESAALRERAVRPETVKAVIELPKLVDERFNRSPYLSETRLDGKSSQTLRLVTSEGWSIYLDVAGDIGAQLDNAAAILKSRIGADRKSLDYIDVRFGDKVFFKLKG